MIDTYTASNLSLSISNRLSVLTCYIALVAIVCLPSSTVYSQSHQINWQSLRLEQYDCGLSSGAAASYDDVDHSQLIYDDIIVNLIQSYTELQTCAAGKIRYLNGGQNYVYTTTLDGHTLDDCSSMTISFSEPVYNVSFDIIDIDKADINNWQDEVTFDPIWSSIDHNQNLEIDSDKGQISGKINCGNSMSDCNTRLYYDDPLMSIEITYCYGKEIQSSHPDRQLYNIGDLSFSQYETNTDVNMTGNCPTDGYTLSFKDIQLNDDQRLEILLSDSSGKVDSIITYTKSNIYTNGFTVIDRECGTYESLIRIVSHAAPKPTHGHNITTYIVDAIHHWQVSTTLFDEESPYFTDEELDTILLYCDEDIPTPNARSYYDNCSKYLEPLYELTPTFDISQECYYEEIKRYTYLIDACGNIGIDSTVFLFKKRDEIESTVSKVDGITACNIMSPNGDGTNDYFYYQLHDKDVINVELYIYDRYGTQLYNEKQSIDESSESKFGGDLRSYNYTTGVYVWLIKTTTIDGQSQVYTGDITLIY